MKKVLLTVVLCVCSNVLFAQYSPVSKNIISTNLLQFFEQPAGFGIAYERMLDKGRSYNVAQFSMKLNVKKISDTDRDAYQTFEDQLIYDEDAYQYSGYALIPEVKYYFGWNAPFGPYFSLFGKYSNYQESFKDLADENNNYNSNITAFGRGVGTGYQFIIKELVVVDLGVGYMIQDKKTEKQGYGEDSFIPMSNEKKDGVRLAVSIGTAF
tara:strand:+ start:5511 stop:6143 length:633 start_codon:yes stop_codon:yes gene_type:complete